MQAIENFGFVASPIDGSEHIYVGESLNLPDEYNYILDLPLVWNQGSNPICVTCSSAAFLNWKNTTETGEVKDINVNLFDIYKSKTTIGDGMTFKDAFRYLRYHGVKSDVGVMKIGSYAMVRSAMALKSAIVENGPCLIALPVFGSYDYIPDEFWKEENGQSMGGHAVCVVGYTDKGFIIRNSWGRSFGTNGHVLLKYDDYKYVIEAWTILS